MNSLQEFVFNMCKGRDPSHGYEHMKKVYENSLLIYQEEQIKDTEIQQLITYVAWLHDVADHKYDRDGSIKKELYNYLMKVNPTDAELIVKIIDRISFSKEDNAIKNKEKLDWIEQLGEKGCTVRNIVSDADKLEALGKIGVERCMEYRKEKYYEEKKKEIPKELLVIKVKEHAKEKLLRLKDEFMRTECGKKLAVELHKEMEDELKKL